MNQPTPFRTRLGSLFPFLGLILFASASFSQVNHTRNKVATTNGDDTFLSIDDVTNSEGDGGSVSYTFTVTRTGNTALSSSVDYETADDTATVTDSDYQFTSGTLTFAENETTKIFTVFGYGDTTFEPDETFIVNLSNASNATIDDGNGIGTIVNDDSGPTFSIDNVMNNEGDSGQTSFAFTVTKNGASGQSSSVDYATVDGTAMAAANDYVPASGTLFFSANETTIQVTVQVNGDITAEPDEAFSVQLSNVVNNRGQHLDGGSSVGTGTILNDDPHVAPVVTNTSDSDTGSLRQALADADPGDTITFNIPTSDAGYNAGVWTINLTSGELLVDKDVTISGPGADALVVRRDPNASPFRIFNIHSLGQGAGNSNNQTSLSSGVTIQGMTISNGVAFTASPFIPASGSGIYNNHTNLTVDSCVLSGNVFAFPFPPGNGGGIYNDGSISGAATLTVINSNVSSNHVGAGGGIYNNGSNGGSATLTVTSSSLTGNSASEVGGGAIYNDASAGGSASLTLTNSTLSGNSASHGGGIYNTGSSSGTVTATINNSTLNGNSGSQSGGAVFNDGGNGSAGLAIINSTLSGNGDAGAIIANFGLNGIANVTISNSTLSENSAPIIANVGTVTIGNTILEAESAGGNLANFFGSITSSGYNLTNDDGSGLLTAPGDQINTDPMLGPLKDNGGPTLTHAPLVNSPAIDHGKRDTIPALATNFDQRGLVRPTNDPAVANAAGSDGSDIGAVEVGVGVHPTSAASWKTHGTAGSFAIDLPFSGPVGIECRSGGASNDYQLIVTFAQPVSFSSAEVTSGVGSVSSTNNVSRPRMSGVVGTEVTITLTGVTNAQTLTVALFGVNDGTTQGDVGVRMGVLVGDTTDDGTVNSSDVSHVKMQSGQLPGADNFRADVIANGAINASDVSAVKFNSGSGMP